MAKGWVSVYRSIWNSWVWEDKPFSKGQAWIDMILMANHKDNKTLIGSTLITVERGSKITSIRKLCDRWDWSNTKVRNFLKLLEKDNMIEVKSDSTKTTFKVLNYNDYQDMGDSKSDTTAPPGRQQSDTKTLRKHTNNNVNNENNENNVNKNTVSRREIYDYYISLNLIKHRKFTQAMDMAIKTAMKNNGYTVEDCKILLDRHKQVVEITKDNEYPVRVRPLHEFFGQKAYQAKHLICAEYDEGGKYYNLLKKEERKSGESKQNFDQYADIGISL